MTPEPADNPTSTTSTDVPTDAKKSAWQGQFAKWAFAGVTALALIGALVSVWTVFKLNGIQEILAKQTSDVSTQAVEARVTAKQAEELARDTAARLAVTDAKLSEVALQRAQLEDLMQSLSRSRDENLVVDIESAIRLAQQQSQLTGSVQPLLAALQSSQMRLTKVAQPRLAPLLRAIVRDIEQIKATPVTDTPTLLIKIDELVRAVDNLVLLNAVGASAVSNASAKPATAPDTLSWARAISMSWWEKMLNDLWRNAQGLVRISRIDRPEASLLAPEQSYFVRENLKLRLLNVRLAVLARHFESAQADMNQVTRDLNKYFDVASGQGPLTLALAREVLAQSKNTEIPRIDATLAALTTAAAGR
ncbi:MAG: uroporphyrinogen-III C-methyltransferase [Limnohabitans sp.]